MSDDTGFNETGAGHLRDIDDEISRQTHYLSSTTRHYDILGCTCIFKAIFAFGFTLDSSGSIVYQS